MTAEKVIFILVGVWWSWIMFLFGCVYEAGRGRDPEEYRPSRARGAEERR